MAWNKITDMKPLCGLTSLQRLNLMGNCISRVPEELGNLVHLSILHLSNNWISRFPIQPLPLPNLSVFTLSKNDDLPEPFQHFFGEGIAVVLRDIAVFFCCEKSVVYFLLCWQTKEGVFREMPKDVAFVIARCIKERNSFE